MRPALMAVFGTDFSSVRIHVGPEPARIGARAYALGNDLHFAHGQFDTTTRDGLHLIGHELAHVMQQRAGRVASSVQLRIANDPILEAEANLVGQCVAETILLGELPARPIYALTSAGSPKSLGAIQCLMEFEVFKSASSAPGMRNKIVPVDNALKEYNRLDKTRPRNWVGMLAQIRILLQACQTYSRERPNSNRQNGIDTLVRQIAVEEPIVAALAGYQNAATPDTKWECVEQAQERYLKFRSRPEYKSSISSDELKSIIETAKIGFETSGTGAAPILRDLEELRRIAADPLVPGVLRAVIVEVAAARNVQHLSFAHGNPYAKYNVTRGATTKYTLNHALFQGMGKAFRLGSLLHELTHVAIAETFGNTVIMLSVGPEATDEEMWKLVVARKSAIEGLQSLVNSAPLLEPGAPPTDTGLTEDQKKELIDKAGYATGIKMSSYLQVLANFPKATNAPAHLDKEVAVSMNTRLLGLARRGMGSELVEYDTVINQMALWCHLWKLPLAHPVYRTLLDLARSAYTFRLSYRYKRRPLPVPTRKPPNRPPPNPPVFG
jgi:hypothetical protein